MRLLWILARALPWLLAAAASQAAQFAVKPLGLGAAGQVQALHIEGVAQDGDGQKLRQFLAALPPAQEQALLWVALNSEGGSLREALAMARQLRSRGFVTHVPAESRCISACLFLYAAGLVRVPALTGEAFKPHIGVHRAFLQREFLAGLTLAQAQELTRSLQAALERAFREFDIPAAIAQSAMGTASSQVYWLSEAETRSLGTYPAWFEEYLLARCERLQRPEISADATALTREKSACALRLIQEHRRQSPGPLTVPPAAGD